MDDKNSKIYIDPFKFPTDKYIEQKWDSWTKEKDAGSNNPCKISAIKWLQCMGFINDLYKIKGGDVNDGMMWHKYMLNKCYAPYTDYHGCRIDEREEKFQRRKKELGPEKHQERVELVKQRLAEQLGGGNNGRKLADKMWDDYREGYNDRFHAMIKAIDEEKGIIRYGQKVPDFEEKPISLDIVPQPSASAATATTATGKKSAKGAPAPTTTTTTTTTNAEEETKSKSFFLKGWWSEPESRFKKKGRGDDS